MLGVIKGDRKMGDEVGGNGNSGNAEPGEVNRLGTAGRNGRGFPEVVFVDSYGSECRMSASSVIYDYQDAMDRPGTSAIWLGLAKVEPKVMAKDALRVGVVTSQTTGWVDYPIPEGVLLSASMHLNREQAQGLVHRLQEWLEDGQFEEAPQPG